jgi:hypothetical protein
LSNSIEETSTALKMTFLRLRFALFDYNLPRTPSPELGMKASH